ncbi:MAG: TetR-like C-terminal domain-containing protein [Paracoccaceae bacterium]
MAVGRGYLTFALNNQGLFNLMFGGTPRDLADENLNQAADDTVANTRTGATGSSH